MKETFPHLILQKSNIVKVSTDSTGIIFYHAPTQFFLYNSFQKLVNIPLRFLLITIWMLYYFFFVQHLQIIFTLVIHKINILRNVNTWASEPGEQVKLNYGWFACMKPGGQRRKYCCTCSQALAEVHKLKWSLEYVTSIIHLCNNQGGFEPTFTSQKCLNTGLCNKRMLLLM